MAYTNLSFDNIIVKKQLARNQIMFTRRKCIYLDRYLQTYTRYVRRIQTHLIGTEQASGVKGKCAEN